MTSVSRSCLVVIALLAMALPVAAQAPAPSDAPPALTQVCASCHPVDRIIATRRSRDQWQELIENMISRGAKGTDEQLTTLMDYLVSHVGRVGVNRALGDELVAVLAITDTDARAIVDYRKAHGPFADIDALTAVPGIDTAKLKARLDAISF